MGSNGDLDRSGDDGAPARLPVEALAARYRTPLLRYFLRRRFTPDAAEDCAQETFVRLARADYARIEAPESYLFTIASSVAVDRGRRALSRSQDAHDPIDDVELVSESPSPARILEGKEAILRLAAALNELPARTKEVFLLNRLEGLTYTQLAARFDVSMSSIEKHMSKALSHLRVRLKDD